MIENYNIIVTQEQSTVVAKYEAQPSAQQAYQSEAVLEANLIKQLEAQGYEYAKHIKDEKSLIENLRVQLEKLNDYHFTDNEWQRLFDAEIAGPNLTIEDKTIIIQKEHIRHLVCDNGESRNIQLIDKHDIYHNYLQVINQYIPDGGSAKNRYDVTILVNGLPLVHCELKKRGNSIKEAFNQINRYQRESFWAGRALFDYVQIFVISNGTHTKYYSNTTRMAKESENVSTKQHAKRDCNSFEFTSWWSDERNNILPDLRDFTNTFFAKHTLLNIITKYCVFTCDKTLLVMRPYQIAATEKILLRIQTAINNRWQGTKKAGGYIWHTTGSGKTLTSFKTAQLATQIDKVSKVLFVVDRKDLDYQTMKEYDNFEKDCANSNVDFKKLLKQLNDPNCHIIITTIQKLSTLLKKKATDVSVLEENVVMIFDECHRSQFGEMHSEIVKKFKKYLIFGFTGTPIFPENAPKNGRNGFKTTADLFGGEIDDKGNHTQALHKYTVIHAINDKNVLPFHVDYISTMKAKAQVAEANDAVWGIEENSALHSPIRYRKIVEYVLDHYNQKTKQSSDPYALNVISNVEEVVKDKRKKVVEQKSKKVLTGFNSILAADSVESAMAYYAEFKKQLAERNSDLKIATIYTYAANEEENDLGYLEDEGPENVSGLSQTAKDFLKQAIDDYNDYFKTEYSLDGDNFGNFYKDVSLRMKNKELDILIVVGMFLTGFDAKTLNTLWVDKNLKMHGLLQAYSRTNRILNAIKNCGNIVSFRNLAKKTDESFALFGDENAGSVIIMRPFKDYYFGYDDEKGHHKGYKELVEELQQRFPIEHIKEIISEDEKKEFVRLFTNILRCQNLLSSFDQYCPEDQKARTEIQILSDFDKQDYLSWYNTLHEELRGTRHEKENIADDVEFEMELVRQIQINIDYILALVAKYHEKNCQDKEMILKIQKSIDASPDMRDKKELIMEFINRMTPDKDSDIYADWTKYVQAQKAQQLSEIIKEENLNEEATNQFIERAFEDGYVTETGTAITKVLPPMPLFGGGVNRQEIKERVLEKLKAFFERFFNLG